MRVLGISGSLRRDSLNRRLLGGVARLLPGDATLELFGGLREVPAFDEDLEVDPPAVVRRLRRAINAADAVLVATPEYNSSIPGHLKNALDWVSRPVETNPLRNKPVAVIGASTGMFGAVWAQAELRKVLGAIGARVVDRELPVRHADDALDQGGSLLDPDLRLQLEATVEDLLGLAVERAEHAIVSSSAASVLS